MTEQVSQTLTLVLVVFAFGIGGYFRKRADRLGGKVSRAREGRLFAVALRLPALLVVGLLFLYIVHPPTLAWAKMHLPEVFRWLGAGASIAVVGLLYWVFSSLDRNVTDTVVVRPGAQLVTCGPYRWVRHPLYAVGSLLWLNLSLLTDLWIFFPFLAVSLILLIKRTSLEEQELLRRFGDDYRRYTERTGRFFPRARILHAGPSRGVGKPR